MSNMHIHKSQYKEYYNIIDKINLIWTLVIKKLIKQFFIKLLIKQCACISLLNSNDELF